MAKKRTTPKRLSRREALRLAGTAGAAALAGGAMLEEPASAAHHSGGSGVPGPPPVNYPHVADACDLQWHNPACGGNPLTWNKTCTYDTTTGKCTCAHSA